MGLADTLKQENDTAPKNSICSIAKAKVVMKKEDIATLDKALYDRNIKASVLGRALRKEGIDISETTITRHRNGWCKTCAS
jgi:hypothetical protein